MSEDQSEGKKGVFYTVFLAHPESVKETYFQHFCFAFSIGFRLVCAGVAGIVHAFIPCCFQKKVRCCLCMMYNRFCEKPERMELMKQMEENTRQ